jgi:hypothetical protein
MLYSQAEHVFVLEEHIASKSSSAVRETFTTACRTYQIQQSIIIHNVAINYFNTIRKLTLTSFFNTVPLLFNALGPLLHKLPYALRKECFELNSEPRMYRFLHISVRGECFFEETKQVK